MIRLLDSGSLRLLRHQPGLAALVILGVAISLSVATTAFGVIYGVFLTPLPVPGGERIVFVWDQHRTRGYNVYISGDEYSMRRQHASAFEHLAGFTSRAQLIEPPGGVVSEVRAAHITPNAFSLIGIQPVVGRGLLESDAEPGAPPVVVIGFDVWQARLGGTADVAGSALRVAGETRTVVGVMPRGVRFPLREDLWLPSSFAPGTNPTSRLMVIGKLKPGISLTQAEDELRRLAQSRERQNPELADLRQRVLPFTRGIGGPEQVAVLWAVAALLTLLLFVAAANVANLVLARYAARTGEIALRTALGASRRQLVWLLLIESFVLTALGAIVALIAVSAGLAWVRSAVTSAPDFPWWAEPRVSPEVFLFLVALTFIATVAIGLAPALRTSRAAVFDVLKHHSATVAGVRFGSLSAAMVAVEFAIAVAFVGAAGTIGRSLLAFSFVDYRLPASEVMVSQLYFGPPPSLPNASTDERTIARRRHYDDSIRRLDRIGTGLRGLPGVRTVSVASAYPGNEVEPIDLQIEAGTGQAGARHVGTRLIEIGAGYFETLDVRPIAGRDFAADERVGRPRVAIVNEPFARNYLDGTSPLGRRVRVVGESQPAEWLEIVGVVRDLGVNPGDPRRADAVYIPLAPTSVARLAVRVHGNPRELSSALLDLTNREAPQAQVQWTVSLEDQMSEVVAVFRRIGMALVAIGGTALLFSAASLYAIVSFAVTRRTREIGVRVALGSPRHRVLADVIGREARRLAIGALFGLAGSVAIMRLLQQIPFDIQPAGWWLTTLFALGMLGVGLSACTLPARRALTIEPVEALRQD